MKVAALAAAAVAVLVLVVFRVAHPPAPAFAVESSAGASPLPLLGSSPAASGARHARAHGNRGDASPSTTPASAVVYVAGAVVHPGVYAVGRGKRVDDAVRAAGGALPSADLVAINLAAPLVDGTEIVVRTIGDSAARVPRSGAPLRAGRTSNERSRPAARAGAAVEDAEAGGDAPSPAARRNRGTSGRTHKKAPPAAPIDINVAEAAEIATLPGIGLGLAQRIVDFREANGPFADPSDLLDVSGITERRLADIAPYVTVGS